MKKTILATAILAALVTFGGTNDISTLEQRLERIEKALNIIRPCSNEGMGALGVGLDVPNPTSKSVPLYGQLMSTEEDFNNPKFSLMRQEWNRDSDAEGKGFKTTICCGFEQYKGVPHFVFREIEFDKYGLVRKISKAKYAVMCWYMP